MLADDQHEHGLPTEGMCCLCTMEDITIEDKNYVEYQSYPSMRWKPALFEKCVVEQVSIHSWCISMFFCHLFVSPKQYFLAQIYS